MVLTADLILKRTFIRVPLPETPPEEAAVKATAPDLVVTLQRYSTPMIFSRSWLNPWISTNSSAALSYSSTNWMESMICPSLGGSTTMLTATVTVSPTLPRTSSEVMVTGVPAATAADMGSNSSAAIRREMIFRFIQSSFM